jgi:hypothetical protein
MRMQNRGSLHRYCLLTLALLAPATARAQNWELEVHGGIGTATNPGGGSGSVPGTGSASAATVGSWYFGDGAMAVNQSLTFFGLNGPIAPLDSSLTSRFFYQSNGATVGGRLDRVLTPRFSAEFSVDSFWGSPQPNSSGQAALATSSASFITAWNGLLNAPARGTQTVTSTATTATGGRQIAATAGILYNLTTSARVRPYVTAGAGIIRRNGGASAQLTGTYQFTAVPANVPGVPPTGSTFQETDAVTLAVPSTIVATGVFGFGVRIATGERWSMKIDVRDYVSPNTASTTVSTAPASQVTQPTGIFILGTSPPLQFSTVPGTASTLSQSLTDVTTFSASGVQQQLVLSLGISWRF